MESEIKKNKRIPHRKPSRRYQKMYASENKMSKRIAFQLCVCVILIGILLVISHIKSIQYVSAEIKNAISTDMSEKQAQYIKNEIVTIVEKIKNVKSKKANITDKKTYNITKTDNKNSTNSNIENKNISKQSVNTDLWYVPLKGIITSFFGERENPTSENTQFHEGIDIAADENTDVYAARSGTVEFSGYSKSYGNEIKIESDGGYETLYGHLNKSCVKDGEKVKAGQLIAYSGNTGDSTGPHLHFGIYKNGTAENPMDFYKENDFEN
ncbi:MAG: M23 family metallopeptidase [Clostridia bacterium]|jgi:murein DD-endopeptidase MepM/ murein hydrolase activator NlpD|nr:M23 family metallopeptidase [Clostridia bacterium]